MPMLVKFYDPEQAGKDPSGRTLDTMLAWPDSHLENAHD